MNQQIDTYQPHAPAPAPTLMQKGVEKLRQHAELKAMAFDYAEFITKTGACPAIYKGKPMDAAAAIIRGTALGFDPDGALEAFFVIHGRVGMYARAMIAVAENVGCRVWEEEASDESVTWAGTRPGDTKVERVTWDTKRVKQAGYDSNGKYKTNPLEMKRAKCQTELARILAPGALMGLVSEAEPDAVQPIQQTATRIDRKPQRGGAGVMNALNRAKEPKPEDADVEESIDWLYLIAQAENHDALNHVMNQAQQAALPDAEYEAMAAAANTRWEELTAQAGEQ